MTPTRTHFGVYAYFEKQEAILLIKKARGPYTGRYDLPGGTPEEGETPKETLVREVVEETGLKVTRVLKEFSVESYFTDYVEKDGQAGCFYHKGVIFKVELEGTVNKTGDGLDSNGAVWVQKSQITAQNSSPFVLLMLKK